MRLLLPFLALLVLATLILQSPLNGPAEAAGLDRTRPALLDCTGAKGVSAKQMHQAQQAWARYLGCKVEETVEIGRGVTMTFVLVPPGTFRMGSPADEKEREEDEWLHVVTLTEPFFLGKYEVTQAQYQALTGTNPSHFKGPNLPVETVTWEEASAYATKLTKKHGDRQLYRLPTEAEWEYTCRCGRPFSMPFGIGDGLSLSSGEANFKGNFPYGDAVKGVSLEKTSPVGSYQANALSLHDMHGNVWEWCSDWYAPYPKRKVTNPTGPSRGSDRVSRGGSWYDFGFICRAAFHYRFAPSSRYYDLGFRLARSAPPAKK